MFTFALKPRKEMEETLKDKTAKGIFWGGMSNGLQQLLNLIFGIFLGRLLSPTDYGMVGMLTIFSLIAGSLQESGYNAGDSQPCHLIFLLCVIYTISSRCSP